MVRISIIGVLFWHFLGRQNTQIVPAMCMTTLLRCGQQTGEWENRRLVDCLALLRIFLLLPFWRGDPCA